MTRGSAAGVCEGISDFLLSLYSILTIYCSSWIEKIVILGDPEAVSGDERNSKRPGSPRMEQIVKTNEASSFQRYFRNFYTQATVRGFLLMLVFQ